jgi:hypothetical protein
VTGHPSQAALFGEEPTLLLAELVHCCGPRTGTRINRAFELTLKTPVVAGERLWFCAAGPNLRAILNGCG